MKKFIWAGIGIILLVALLKDVVTPVQPEDQEASVTHFIQEAVKADNPGFSKVDFPFTDYARYRGDYAGGWEYGMRSSFTYHKGEVSDIIYFFAVVQYNTTTEKMTLASFVRE